MSSLTTDRPITDPVPTARPVVWTDRRRGVAVLVGVAILAALLSAWVTPRGP